MRIEIDPYRWRLSGSFLAHLFKATTRQHHRAVAATIMRLVPPASVVFDVGAPCRAVYQAVREHDSGGPGQFATISATPDVRTGRGTSGARAGDRLDDAFAFLDELGYAAFELAPGEELVPVKTRHDGDFWFISREDPTA